MRINKFAIETFVINTKAADGGTVSDEGEIRQSGTEFSGFLPKGNGFGKVTKVDVSGFTADYNDLHTNIYMTSSVNSGGDRFVYSGSLSAPGDPSDGLHAAAHGIFVSKI